MGRFSIVTLLALSLCLFFSGLALAGKGGVKGPSNGGGGSGGGGKQNSVPVAIDDSVAVNISSSVSFNVVANDSDNDKKDRNKLAVIKINGAILNPSLILPSGATLNASSDGSMTYFPNANSTITADSFSYVITDGKADSNIAQVAVSISGASEPPPPPPPPPPNIAPSASFSFSCTELNCQFTNNSADSDGSIASSVWTFGDGANSTLGNPSHVYSSDGTYTVRLQVTDNLGATGEQVKSITVAAAAPPPPPPPPNQVPQANNDSASLDEGASVSVNVLANDSDPDGDAIHVTQILTTPANGSASVNADQASITYIPNAGYSGSDSLVYQIADSNGATAAATLNLTIIGSSSPNENPVAKLDYIALRVGENTILSVLDNDFDPDGDTLFVESITQPEIGVASLNGDGTISYYLDPGEPISGYYDTTSLYYTISDGRGGTSSTLIILKVLNENSPDFYISALLHNSTYYRLNYPNDYGTPVVVTFAFPEEFPAYYNFTSEQIANLDFHPYNEDQKQVVRALLQNVANFSQLTFVETGLADAVMTFGFAYLGGADGVAYKPLGSGVGTTSSDIWLSNQFMDESFANSTSGLRLLLHETGHAMGLSHGDYEGVENTKQYSIMNNLDGFSKLPSDYQLYDIAALQFLYGANYNFALADDNYDFTELDNEIRVIWDSGGHDVIDMSAATYSVKINLNPGTFSTVAPSGSNNLAIAFETVIEDVIGSSFADYLTSNAANNTLTGGAGNDTFVFKSNWGADVVTDFQSGQDKIDLSSDELSFSDLTISTFGGNTEISYGANTILLLGVASVSAADFM